MAKDVYLYSSNYCPYCSRAKALLASKKVAFRELIVDGNPELRQQGMAASGQRTVPQIWIGDTHVGGCDDLYDLERAGALDDLLSAEGIALN